ncbi:MAG TPA: STAS domain-containing protein [Roseiflexaceae bacterium]|nr:STAS domain-containing protein [Roseiflexaceae bacterium]
MFQWVLLGWITLASIDFLFLVLPLLFPSAAEPPPLPPGPLPPILIVILAMLWLAAALLWLVPVSALVLLRRGHFKLSVAVATLGLLLTHSIATYILGVTNPSVYVVFQIPIALAGLLAGRRLLLTVSAISIAVMIVVAILESFSPPLAGFLAAMPGPDGSIPSPLAGQPVGLAIAFFVGVTILLTLLLDRFGSALRDALSSSLEREEELNGIRASLETTVAERTLALQTALDDVQARAEEQARLLEEVESQRAMIKDLSVPVIPINASTLVMPLVGALDSTRLRQLREQCLHALEQRAARTLVLDITGVPIVDTQVAQGLLMTVRAARLLGAEVALVGIRPEVAQSIVGLGLELRDVRTFSDLQSALDRTPA